MSIAKSFSRLSGGLWFVPLACVLASVGLSLGTIAIDKAFDYELVPRTISGGPDAAMEILGTVAGAGSPQIARRLHAALEDLLTVAPPERKGPLQEQLDLLLAGAQDAIAEESDRIYSSRGDRTGIG